MGGSGAFNRVKRVRLMSFCWNVATLIEHGVTWHRVNPLGETINASKLLISIRIVCQVIALTI